MIKIKLSVWERLQIIPVLNTSKGFKLEELKDVLEDAKALAISPEEQKEIKFEIIGEKNDKGEYTKINGYKWDAALAKELEYKLSEPVKKFLKKHLEEKEKSEGFSIQDIQWVDLLKKIE